MSYDRFLTIFSPEGRLYQIEYCTAAVKRSNATLLTLTTKTSTVIVSQKSLDQPIFDNKLLYRSPENLSRIFQVSPTVSCALVGPIADCKAFVLKARQEASSYSYKYGFPMPVEELAARLGDLAQINTQHAGRRTLACESVLFGVQDYGLDEDFAEAPKNVVFKVEPSGHVLGYYGVACGKLGQEVNAILERKFLGKDLDEESAMKVGIAALQKAAKVDFKPEDIEVCVVDAIKGSLKRLSEVEIEQKLNQIIESDE
eukprot:snap_masked-scaffold_24-processed-gene-3.27-mRNA-1 protein AED:0.29 eAED:0.29 QI:0/-1/0/1/-1/1/1/0/256